MCHREKERKKERKRRRKIIIIIIRNGAKTIRLQTLFGSLNKLVECAKVGHGSL